MPAEENTKSNIETRAQLPVPEEAPPQKPPPQPPEPVMVLPPAAPLPDKKASISWDAVREWGAVGMSFAALMVSVLGYFNSQTATKLAQAQFDSDRAIIVVAEKADKEGSDYQGTMFKFHPLSNTQRLSELEITFPSVIEKGAVRAIAPEQQISLLSESFTAGDYFFKEAGKIKPGTFGFMETTIPVVLDAFYSVAGVSAQRRGLYYLTANMIINDNDTRAKVSFEDFAFVQELQDDADSQKTVDDLFAKHQVKRNHTDAK